jgi:hypothetical protein
MLGLVPLSGRGAKVVNQENLAHLPPKAGLASSMFKISRWKRNPARSRNPLAAAALER